MRPRYAIDFDDDNRTTFRNEEELDDYLAIFDLKVPRDVLGKLIVGTPFILRLGGKMVGRRLRLYRLAPDGSLAAII